jgi:hypothetical protein
MAPPASNSPYPFLPPLSRRSRGGTAARVQDLIRNALGRLAAEGLVEVLPQRRTCVARIRLAEAYQAMFIRRAFETPARAHAAA